MRALSFVLIATLWVAAACDRDGEIESLDTVEGTPDIGPARPSHRGDVVADIGQGVADVTNDGWAAEVNPISDGWAAEVSPISDGWAAEVNPICDGGAGDMPEPTPECGDGACDPDEDPCECPADCPPAGGDGGPGAACCDATDCAPLECGPCCVVECQGFQCSDGIWLDDCCWNGECEEGEDWLTCPEDCPKPSTECEQEGGYCAAWDPGYTNCTGGTVPAGYMCESKSEVCCIEGDEPPPLLCDDPTACLVDADCVKTAAGCCPCSMGGTSIALNTACVDGYNDALGCSPDIACMAVYVCDDSVPACEEGQCVLVGGGLEPGF